MTTTRVFIGGSRAVARIPSPVRQRLENIVERGHTVLVGDANGADKAVQRILHDFGYTHVVVFCAGGSCRNNLGAWPTRSIDAAARKGTREFYTAKDRAMTDEASVGLMLWDGESAGTLANVLRMLQQEKPVVVFRTDTKTFVDLKRLSDWSALSIPTELRAEVESAERLTAQRDLF